MNKKTKLISWSIISPGVNRTNFILVAVFTMKKIKILVVFLLLITGIPARGFADVSKTPLPSWVEPVNIATLLPKKDDEGNNSTSFLLVDEQINHAAADSQHYYHYAQKIRNENGLKSASQIAIDFDPEYQTLQLHVITILRGTKIINKLTSAKVSVFQREADLENSVFDGRKTATIILEDVHIGDVVEYSYSRTGSNPAFGKKLFEAVDVQWAVPVKKVFYKIITAKNTPLYFKPYLTDKVFSKTSVANQWHYRYQADDIPAIYRDEEIPSWYNPYPWIQISQFNQWQEVVDWALPLFKIAEEPPVDVRKAALSITTNQLSPEQRILKVLKFTQDDIRYTGIEMGVSAYKPHAPEVVLERRFGDCKDKVVLFISMLRTLGLDAYPVLVNTRMRSAISTLQPSATDFNHVIALVEHNGKQFWLDPTISAQFGTLNNIYQPDYGYGLVLRKGEVNLTAINPLKVPPLEEKIVETFEVNYDDMPTVYKIKTEYLGNSADNMRHYFNNNEQEKIAKEFLSYTARYYPSIEPASAPRAEDNKDKNIFTVHEEYRLDKFWELVKEAKRFKADFFQPNLINMLKETQATKRSMPLATAPKREVHIQTQIKLKESWPIKAGTRRIDDKAFVFERTVTPEGNNFRIDYRYQSLADSVPPDQVSSYAKNIAAARDLIGYSINTTELNGVKADPDAKVTEYTLNWAIVFVLVMSVMIAFAVCYKVYKYDPEPNAAMFDQNYVGIKGWLILPALGLILAVFRYLRDSTDFWGYLDLNQWHVITLPTSGSYHSLYAPIIIGEIVANVLMFGFLLMLIVLFFRKRSSVPKLYVVYMLTSILILFIDHFIALQIPVIAEKTNPTELPRMIGNAVGGLIWVTYFIKSKRAASTFTRRWSAKKRAA